ncbi:MAG TPA: M12 family metallo-peptidase, partial [Phycisphaerales bacterium]|nr:M12 family metallo-peptidase [Phycisphaerales bacterium]
MTRSIRLGFAAFAAVGAASVAFPVLADGVPLAAGARGEALRAMGLRAGRVVPVSVASFGAGSAALTIGVELGTEGRPRVGVFDVDPYPLRAPGFRVMASGADGVLHEAAAPAPTAFHGKDRTTGDELWASVVGMQVRGVVYPAGGNGPSVYIQPLEGGAAGEHVVYKPEDVLPIAGECGLDHCPECMLGPVAGLGARGPGCKYVEMIAEADYPFYQLNAGSVGATVQDIEAVMLGVNAIYRNQAGFTSPVRFALKQVTVWTTSAADPYNAYPLVEASSNGILATQATRWFGIASPARDVVHLFTGRDLDGSTVGLAYTPGYCNPGGQASLVQSRFTPILAARYADSAHELGHNFGMVHDAASGYIMYGAINPASPATSFSPASVSTYNSNIAGFTCLSNSYPDVLPDGAQT